VVHIAVHCHTMRCYNCSGFRHKSHDLWNTRIQSMRSASYSMSIRKQKEDDIEKMESQNSSYEKLGHLQKWMKKTNQPK
jgi:hypothetical protein